MEMHSGKVRNAGRRDFLRGAGCLVVSFALPISGQAASAVSTRWPAKVDAAALDSWIAVHADGSVTASVGKIEAGMGVSTSFAQVVAEELDIPLARVTIEMGNTATTVDQRGTGSSNGIMQGVPALRAAAAQARQVLLGIAAGRLQVDQDRLQVQDGMVSAIGQTMPSIGYGELLEGQRFEIALDRHVAPKDPRQYRLVGQPVPRTDIPAKVTGRYPYLVNFRVPGMLHARVIRPPQAGAHLLGVDRKQSLPGLIRIVTQGDFVAVVCEREEQAVAAAQRLKVKWSEVSAPIFSASYDALYETLRTATPEATEVKDLRGDPDGALAAAARIVEARYDYPFQSHTSMGPACAIADVRADSADVWMAGQKPYPLRQAVAGMLSFQPGQVRVIWMAGPGSYGVNDADDAAVDAVLLSRAVGHPVRVQYMRHDATAWDPKGPPITVRMRAGLDDQGQVSAMLHDAHGYSGRTRRSGTDDFADSLAAQLIGGVPAKSERLFQFADERYGFRNKRKTSALIPWQQSLSTGLRTSHLRDPDGPATCFASESFIDELAAATHADPVAFRLGYLTGERDREAVKAAARLAGWQPRTAPSQPGPDGLLRGRGIAYAPRGQTIVAVVAEVEVHPDTGNYRVTRFCVAHDCGFVINPRSLRGTIEANLIHAMSRAKHEAVQFEPDRVTSVDWLSYPIVDITEVPDRIDIAMLNNRPDAASSGAGEPSSRPVPAAIANALFDATGVRLRRVPLRVEDLKAGLDARRA